MQFDEFLMIVGEFGLYQKRTLFLLALTSCTVGFHMLSIVIFLEIPNHRCKIPEYPNDTFEIQNEFHRYLINKSIPIKTYIDKEEEYEKCEVFIVNNKNLENASHQRSHCDTWVYDKTYFKSTFATENNFVCDRGILTANASMVVFAGVLFGSVFLGWLSDVLGRKKTFYISLILLFLSSVSLSWAPEFYSFCICRFLIGVACIGLEMTSFVLAVEITGPSRRGWVGPIKLIFFPLGLMILIIVSYGIRDWKYIEIVGSVPIVLFLPYWWVIPESPRWLMSRGTMEDAKEILRCIARVNRTKLPEKQLAELQFDSSRTESGKLWHIFTSCKLVYRTLIIFFNWLVVSMVYYGFSINTRNLFGNFYLNFFLSALAEFPGQIICLVLLNRIGRKATHSSLMILGGISCVSTILTTLYLEQDLQPFTIALGLLGKVGATAAFTVMYTWTSEIFPTVVRNAGLGASSIFGSTGGLISSFIADLSKVIDGNIGKAIPLTIFGGLSLLAGLLSLCLPETMNRHLPDTIEDVKRGDKLEKYYEQRINETDVKDTAAETML